MRLLRALVSWLRRLLFGSRRAHTVTVSPERFGNSAKAEFYPIQPNPQSSDGQMIFRVSSPEEIYVVPRPLLTGADLARADAVAGGVSALNRVEITLTAGGRSKLQAFLSSGTADAQVALVWQNEVHYRFPARMLDSTGAVVVADGLDQGAAARLAAALM